MLTQLLCSAALLAAPPVVEDEESEASTPFEIFAAVLRGQSPGPLFGDPAYSPQVYGDPFNSGAGQSGAWGAPAGAPFGPGYFSGLAPLTQYGTRFGLRHHVGEGVSHDDSFTTFELFQPVYQGYSDMWFLDGRFILENDSDIGANVGGGYRYYDPFMDRLWGASVWFDYDDTHESEFHQLGVSLESLGYWLDGRVNVYIPLGDTEETLGFSDPSARFDGGSSILIDAIRRDEVALTGVDLEVGTAVPGLDPNVRAYAGYYHFGSDAAGAPDINGVKGRVEGWVNPNLQLQLEVTHDDTFDTNVLFTVALLFGGSSVPHRGGALPNYGIIRGQTPAPGYIAGPERLYDTVQRNYHVVAADAFVADTLLAINPKTGLPWNVVHVNSNAGAGGDGTRNDPFMTLAEAEAGSSMNDIVFAHAGSVFEDETFEMKDMQRLLGEGVDHYFADIRFPKVLLPRANTDVDFKPLIHGNFNADGAAVIVANNTEISNFMIVADAGSAENDGIKDGTDNLTGSVNINRTEISLVDRGIELDGDGTDGDGLGVGKVTLSKNVITKYGQGSNEEGIFIEDGTGSTTLSWNTVIDDIGARDDPIRITGRTGDVALNYNTALTGDSYGINIDDITGRVRLKHNYVQDIAAGPGIRVADVTNGVSFYGDVVQDVSSDGLFIDDVSGGGVRVSWVDVTGALGDGIDVHSDIVGDVVFENITVMNSGDGDVADDRGVEVGDGGTIDGSVYFLGHNHISGSFDDGLYVDRVSGDVSVDDVYIANSGQFGGRIGDDVGVMGNVSVTNSEFSNSMDDDGLFIENVGENVTVAYTDVTESNDHGVRVATVEGDVSVTHTNVNDANTDDDGTGDGILISEVMGNAQASYNVVDSGGATHNDGIRFLNVVGDATANYNVVNNSDSDGVEFSGVDGDVTGRHNAVSNSVTHGIFVHGADSASSNNVTLTYNVITGSDADADGTGDAIHVEDVFGSFVSITDNKVSDAANGIVAVSDVDIDGLLNVSRNVAVNLQGRGISAVLDDGFTGNGLFADNVVTEFGLGADGLSPISGIFVRNMNSEDHSYRISGNLITDNLDNDKEAMNADPTTGDEEYGIRYVNDDGDNELTIAGNRMFWDDPDNTVGVRLEAPAGSITLVPLSPPLAAQERNITNAELEYSDDGGVITPMDGLLINLMSFP